MEEAISGNMKPCCLSDDIMPIRRFCVDWDHPDGYEMQAYRRLHDPSTVLCELSLKTKECAWAALPHRRILPHCWAPCMHGCWPKA